MDDESNKSSESDESDVWIDTGEAEGSIPRLAIVNQGMFASVERK